MRIPTTVISGFFESGKTTLINQLLQQAPIDTEIVILQLERGFVQPEIPEDHPHVSVCRVGKAALETNELAVYEALYPLLLELYEADREADEIWIENNGLLSMSALYDQLSRLRPEFSPVIVKHLYVADASRLEVILGQRQTIVTEQLQQADRVVLNRFPEGGERAAVKAVHRLQPRVPVLTGTDRRSLKEAMRERIGAGTLYFSSVFYIISAFLILRLAAELLRLPFDAVLNNWLGMVLQALPFLGIGVLVSALIQVFLPLRLIETYFPKKTVPGLIVGIIAGFFMPVCDCASIPVFRSFLRKQVPLPAALAFVTASPIINPVVILSTYYAFRDQPVILYGRIGLGVAAALLVGLVFALRPEREAVLTERVRAGITNPLSAETIQPRGFSGKLLLFLDTAKVEFWSVGGYLLVGALLSSLLQTWHSTAKLFGGGKLPLIPAMLLLLILAFGLSLCSSSDAVIARSLAGIMPNGALMGFLLFGPMMDIKNVLLLSGSFRKRFILRMTLTMAAVATMLALLFHFAIGGGL
ncbi:MAG: permease [Lachnospiraceae bacterium]|nr:permease [Lachnospiraceae bacterium]MDY5741464.1 permease [Lachnospiraceae bacterium]